MASPYPILALDLATSSGWALRADHDVEPEYGSVVFGKKGTGIGEFLAKAEAWLVEMIGTLAPRTVVFESPVLPATTQLATCRKLYSLAGLVELVCVRFAVECREANNQEIKKHFLGDRRAPRTKVAEAKSYREKVRRERQRQDKDTCIVICRERGWDPRNDDEADGLALLDYAVHVLDPSTAAREFALT